MQRTLMRRSALVMVLCVVAASVSLSSQDKGATSPPAPAQKDSAPVLTEVQQLKLQNLSLQQQTATSQIALLQQALRTIDAERDVLIKAIEREHPGWAINRETGRWERVVSPPSAEKK